MPAAPAYPHRSSRVAGSGSRPAGSPPLVLGLDPALRRTGYGVIQMENGRPRIREAGVLLTDDRSDLGDRLFHLHREVTGLLRDLRPDLIVIEDLFAHRLFPRTAILLGHARGIIYLAAAAARLPVATLAPGAVKQAVTGSGRASKAQVQAAVRRLLGLRRLSNHHAADALALAYTGLVRAARDHAAPARVRARPGQATRAVGPG